MSRVRASLAVALLAAGVAQGQDLKPPLDASVRFLDPQGADLAQVVPGQPFQVALSFAARIGSVPSDLAPLAWLRQRGPGDLPCAETAAAYRATGSAALGSVDLNGRVLGVLARDGAMTVLDPQRALGTANLLAAHRFDPAPLDLAADPTAGRFLLTLPERGELVALDPMGGTRVVARGLDRPGPLVAAASGGAWLVEQGSGDVLRPDRGQRWSLGARAIAGDGAPSRRLAVLSSDRLTVLGDDGTTLLSAPAPGALAVGLGPEAALWLGADALHVLWLDAPLAPAQRIALDGSFQRIAVSPEGRMVVLSAPDRLGFGVVDLARGRMVQSALTDSPVAEVAFLPQTAMLRLADGSAVGVMDLRGAAPAGAEPVLGRVSIGPRGAPDGPEARLLVPLSPEPAMLAIHADSFTGFVLDRRHAVSGKPAMEAMRLRGGIPRLAVALDRGLRPAGPGRFLASARLPRPGAWELVVSAGLGQMAFCAMLPVPPQLEAVQDQPGRIQAQADAQGRLRLLFLAGDGRPAADLAGMLDLAALTGNWRQRQGFRTDPRGVTTQSWDLRQRLPLVVTADPETGAFAPLVLEAPP
ncbi:MAG: hypothetical protein QM682_04705 [Paracoccus sp. (in: a-proteobacteria)]|uniref:hypothetical protein n=1 Tax=Paracoccus sp. TaxID=267 RepID=UPI0039E6ACAD